jgi:bifunctional DNA-binding transcriptional regulator/antitoxin component of YhaV-PrlF toxin-antitoxin module
MFGEGTWTRLVSQSCHGRVTIPIEFRRTLGILDAEMLEMTLEEGELRIRRLDPPVLGEATPFAATDRDEQREHQRTR